MDGRRRIGWIVMGVAMAMLAVLPLTAQETRPAPHDDDGDHEQMDEGPEHRSPHRTRGTPGDRGRKMRGGDQDRGRRPERGSMRGQMGDRRGQGRPMMHDASPEDMEKVLDVLRDYDPEMAERIERVKDRNPEEAMRMMRRAAPTLRRIMYLKQTDAEGYELQIRDMRLGVESERIAKEIRRNEREADELTGRLRKVVEEQFEARQQLREHQLHKMEQKLEQLRQQIKQRAESRDKMIDQQVAQLTGKSSGPEW